MCTDVTGVTSEDATKTTVVGNPLHTERLPNGERLLVRDLVVDVEGERIAVPAGTHTDFSSIPSYARFVVRWSKVDIAGVVHDYLYQQQTKDRAVADQIWREVAQAGQHHANVVQAWLGYVALRLFGWIVWARHRELSLWDYWFTLGANKARGVPRGSPSVDNVVFRRDADE